MKFESNKMYQSLFSLHQIYYFLTFFVINKNIPTFAIPFETIKKVKSKK